ncbi:hypothetical protein EGR52_07615 [bacterium]|nr:hypothetical protein [bacterium]
MTANVLTNEEKKIICYGNMFAVISNGKVLKRIVIDEGRLEQKIEEVINKKLVPYNPQAIFKRAVEEITGIRYYTAKVAPVVDGKTFSIHDQEIYKEFYKFIQSRPELISQRNIMAERTMARKKQKEKLRVFSRFCNISYNE